MKHKIATILLALGTAANAQWYSAGGTEGGSQYWAYTNDTGQLVGGNEQNEIVISIWPGNDPYLEYDDISKICSSQDYCQVSFRVEGRVPGGPDQVKIEFSTGHVIQYQANRTLVDCNSCALETAEFGGREDVVSFVKNTLAGEWVEITIGTGDDGTKKHRFSLDGSSSALKEFLNPEKFFD